jgi:[ribosomal protein S18]-alanine N-acetyltransferase
MLSHEPSSSHCLVREFETRDALPVEQLLRKCPEAATWSSSSYHELVSRGSLAWIVEADQSVCGFLVARAVAGQGEILNLAVEPAKRRAGHASNLLQRAIEEFQCQGVADVFLEVRASNSAAVSFYERHGFVRTGTRPDYYQNPTEAAVLMARKLTA